MGSIQPKVDPVIAVEATNFATRPSLNPLQADFHEVVAVQRKVMANRDPPAGAKREVLA